MTMQNDVEKSRIYIFDDELCVLDDNLEEIDGYLWATDELVARMKDSEKNVRSAEEMESIENINFYPVYKIKEGSISIIGTYWYYEGNEEKQGQFSLSLSPEESKTLIAEMETYCSKRYDSCCLSFINDIRKEEGLPAITTQRQLVCLSDKIKDAQDRAAESHAVQNTPSQEVLH